MGEAVLHCADIRESAARIAHGELRAGRSAEEEQPHVPLRRISSFFLVGVNVVEDGFARQHAIAQGADDFHRLVRIDVRVPRQMQIPQRVAAVISRVYREQQPPVIAKDRVGDDRLNPRVAGDGLHVDRFLAQGTDGQDAQHQQPKYHSIHNLTPFRVDSMINKTRLPEKSRFVHGSIPLRYNQVYMPLLTTRATSRKRCTVGLGVGECMMPKGML